jgi:hypothetical protein
VKAQQALQIVREAEANPDIKVETKKTNAYGLRVFLTYRNTYRLKPASFKDWRAIKQLWEVLA